MESINKCISCEKETKKTNKYCSRSCQRLGYKHTEETKQKIAKSNSKPFTEARKRNISLARQTQLDEDLLAKLKDLWSLTYLNPLVIKKICKLPRRSRVYENLKKQFCVHKQLKFMSPEWFPCHYEKLFELASQKVWYKKIAKLLGFGNKQVYSNMKKLNLPINTRNPDAYSSTTSKIEQQVICWIKDANYEIMTQFHMGNFLYDCHINNTNVLLEVNGDYWHCNPKVYLNGPINEMQKSHIRRDFAKKSFAKKQGYYLITVWEKDIKENPEEIKQWILNKIKMNITGEING